MHVRRRPEFRNQRGNFASGSLLRLPYLPPPLFVDFKMMTPLWRTRVRHLRSFFKTHPRVQVPAVFGAQLQNIFAVRQQPFRDAHPVAVIAGQLQRRESLQDAVRIPWIRKVAQAMRLMAESNAEFGFHCQRGTIKILRLGIAPRIGSGMAVDEERIVLETFFDLAFQREQMFRNRSGWSELIAENLRNPCEAFFF